MVIGPIRRLLASLDVREAAAIVCTALVVPAAALTGLTLPLNPNGVVAPIIEAQRALFGGVHDTTAGLVDLVAGKDADDVAAGDRGAAFHWGRPVGSRPLGTGDAGANAVHASRADAPPAKGSSGEQPKEASPDQGPDGSVPPVYEPPVPESGGTAGAGTDGAATGGALGGGIGGGIGGGAPDPG